MRVSLFRFLKSGPPPPAVILLPDALFFSRAVQVPLDASRAEAASRVELALEALAPFPLGQLYHGYFWSPGSSTALAFASYRRRFTVEQTTGWIGADAVLPAFSALLGSKVPAGTTLVLTAPEGLTAIHWDSHAVPVAVVHRPLAVDSTDQVRDHARNQLIAAAGEASAVVDLPAAPTPLPSGTDGELAFKAGSLESRLKPEIASALDVRDKGDLEEHRRLRSQGVLLWRVVMACLIICGLLAAADISMIGLSAWQKTRNQKVKRQEPVVSQIMQDQELANHIDDLSTKRLLPMEMLTIIANKKPPSIQFLRANTSGLNTIQIEAQTPNAGEIGGYKTALQQIPACDKVDIKDQQARANVASFTLVVTFKPLSLKPASS